MASAVHHAACPAAEAGRVYLLSVLGDVTDDEEEDDV